jgi:hypothetical protein
MNGGNGHVIAVCQDDDDPYIPDAYHIERDDSAHPRIYETDKEAARGAERDAERDGIRLIHAMEGVKDGVYFLDTPENREIIAAFLEHKNNRKQRDDDWEDEI